MIDLLFPVLGEFVPTDHAYPLYAALSHRVPAFHDPGARVRFASLTGEPGPPGSLRITSHSRLRVRLPETGIGEILKLAGQRLVIGPSAVRLGVPSVTALVPAATLFARTVILKNHREADTFLPAIREKLTSLGVSGEPSIPLIKTGPRHGQPRRRVVRIKTKRVVGFALLIEGLTATDSIKLQESGLGGRARIGCGFFLPVRPRAS